MIHSSPHKGALCVSLEGRSGDLYVELVVTVRAVDQEQTAETALLDAAAHVVELARVELSRKLTAGIAGRQVSK